MKYIAMVGRVGHTPEWAEEHKSVEDAALAISREYGLHDFGAVLLARFGSFPIGDKLAEIGPKHAR